MALLSKALVGSGRQSKRMPLTGAKVGGSFAFNLKPHPTTVPSKEPKEVRIAPLLVSGRKPATSLLLASLATSQPFKGVLIVPSPGRSKDAETWLVLRSDPARRGSSHHSRRRCGRRGLAPQWRGGKLFRATFRLPNSRAGRTLRLPMLFALARAQDSDDENRPLQCQQPIATHQGCRDRAPRNIPLID